MHAIMPMAGLQEGIKLRFRRFDFDRRGMFLWYSCEGRFIVRLLSSMGLVVADSGLAGSGRAGGVIITFTLILFSSSDSAFFPLQSPSGITTSINWQSPISCSCLGVCVCLRFLDLPASITMCLFVFSSVEIEKLPISRKREESAEAAAMLETCGKLTRL